MKKVIKLNENELKHLLMECARRIIAEDESLGGMGEEFDGADMDGIGDELSQADRWKDYDEAEREHEVNMLNDHPHLYDEPEGYDIPNDFGWRDGEGEEPMGFESMDGEGEPGFGDEEELGGDPFDRAIAEAVNRAIVKKLAKNQANRRAKALEESVDRVCNRLLNSKKKI